MKKKYLKHPNKFSWRLFVKCLFLFVSSSIIFNSCQREVKTKCKDCLILHASLDEEVVSLERLFDKIELIPLETTDNSLIKSYTNIKYKWLDGKHYVLDISQAILLMFDEKGNYLNRIARIGQGPGEYRYIYDFSLNPQKGQIEMLSPYRFIYCYDFNGNYIKTYDLTSIFLYNIQRMQILDDENYIVWFPPNDGQNGINIISQETGQLVNSYWQDIFLINMWSSNVFYSYNNEVYFSLPLYNTVYKVTKAGFEASYEWYFGDKTVDISSHKVSTGMYNYNRDIEELQDKLMKSEILYECMRNYQNKKYYYVQLRFKREHDKHLFFDKKTGESIFFEHSVSVEGYRFDPILYFTDEYMIGVLNFDDKDKWLNCTLLDEENRKKLLSFKDEDNPYLVKYYFK